jgi:hypothetical protein
MNGLGENVSKRADDDSAPLIRFKKPNVVSFHPQKPKTKQKYKEILHEMIQIQ